LESMANFRVTYFMNQGRAGWSETWYLTKDSAVAALQSAIAAGIVRTNLMGWGTRIDAVRVSDEAILFDKELRGPDAFPVPAEGNIVSGSVQNAALDPGDALLCVAGAGQLYHRPFWYRGLPDNMTVWVTGNPQRQWTTGFVIAHNTYVQRLITEQFRFRCWSKDPTVTLPQNITAIHFDGVTDSYKYTVPAHGYAVGTRIKVYGAQGDGCKKANGPARVTKVIPPDDFVTNRTGDLLSLPEYTGGGKVQLQVYTYPQIQTLVPERFVRRAQGRAFFVQRGRQPARK
jgi:hypothetical protein